MIVCILSWTEPQQGATAVLFNDSYKKDLEEVSQWLYFEASDAYGQSIPRMDLEEKEEFITHSGSAAWEYLALNMRYSSGEGVFSEDCPVFKKLGIRRT